MKKSTLANNFIYYLFCGFSGAVIACIVWLFLKLMSLGISFIWETVPSNIRKNYHLEKMPRGKQRGKFSFGSKIAALNFRKLFNYVKGLGHYAQNPVLA